MKSNAQSHLFFLFGSEIALDVETLTNLLGRLSLDKGRDFGAGARKGTQWKRVQIGYASSIRGRIIR